MTDQWTKRENRFDEHPVRSTIKGISWGWLIVLVIIALALVTSALLWGLGVFTSDIKGQGDAQRIKNSAPNRIAAQEQFETRYPVVVDGPQDDGSYGSGDPGIFFFLTNGTKVVTSLDYIQTDQPIPGITAPKLGG
jgi:hypothetical protein